MIVEFAGPDGSGKTTQMRLLAEHIARRGHPVHAYTFDDKPLSRLIVRTVKRLRVVKPLLWVVLNGLNDRMVSMPRTGVVLFDKYCLHSGGQARALGVDDRWLAFLYPQNRRTDLSFLMNLDPEVAYERKGRIWGTECGTAFYSSVTYGETVGRGTFTRFQDLLLTTLLEVHPVYSRTCEVVDASKGMSLVHETVRQRFMLACGMNAE